MILTFNQNMLQENQNNTNSRIGVFHFIDRESQSTGQTMEIISLSIENSLKQYQKYIFVKDDSEVSINLLNHDSTKEDKSGYVYSKTGIFLDEFPSNTEVKIVHTPTNDVRVELKSVN